MKRKIITGLMSILLFNLIGCVFFPYDMRGWNIEIINNLPYPIYVIAIFDPDFRIELGPITPGEIESKHGRSIPTSVLPEAHREIRKVSVFSEDGKPFMILKGKEMDEYVVFKEQIELYYVFSLEVKEEYEGIGIEK